MWKLWAKLFGWKYIAFNYGYSVYVRKLHTTPNGGKYVNFHGRIMFIEHHPTREWTELN